MTDRQTNRFSTYRLDPRKGSSKNSLFSHSSTFSSPFLSSFLSSLLWWIQQPSRKDLFPQILYAIFCLDLLLLSSSYPQYPSTGSTGLSLIITAFHPPRCLLTPSTIINIFLSQVYPARHAPQHCDQHSQILWGNLRLSSRYFNILLYINLTFWSHYFAICIVRCPW